MDTRRIKNFIAVVEAGSIARAAAALHIAQPALSAQMKQLEEIVGGVLLTRSVRGVAPTALGMALCQEGAKLLELAERVKSLGKDLAHEPEGQVNVGLPASIANILSTQLVQATVERFPRVQIRLLESTSAALGGQLLQRRLDIAVLFTDNLAAGLRHEQVLEEDLYVVAAHSMPAEVPLSTLQGLAMVMPARPNSVRLLLDKACAQRQITPQVLAEVSSPYTMLQLAHAGVGATVLPWSMLAHEKLGNLHAAKIIAPRLARTLCIAIDASVPELSRVLAVRKLIRELLHALAASSDWRGAQIKRNSPKVRV